MTIKDFAKLCGCNPQTLRYYDRLNLLKPVRVDEWTGDRSLFTVKDYPNTKQEVESFKKILNDPDYTTVFEKHDWEYVKDFFDDLPEIEDGKEYKFLVRLGEEKKANASFANTLVAVMCMRNPDKRMKVSCNVIASDDGENHFWCRTK